MPARAVRPADRSALTTPTLKPTFARRIGLEAGLARHVACDVGGVDFKTDYDRNAPLDEVVPAVAAAGPERYCGMGLKDLGDETWAYIKESRQGYWQEKAYATLPRPDMKPRAAFQRLMAGDAEKVRLDELANRVVAVGVIPYPRGSRS